jgi:hypothetical protein
MAFLLLGIPEDKPIERTGKGARDDRVMEIQEESI